MKKIILKIKNKKIPIKISKDIIFSKTFIKFLKTLKTNNFVIITDKKIEKLFIKKFKEFLKSFNISTLIISIKEGEKYKTRTTKEQIEDIMLQKKVSKDFCIIAAGGGVICDLASFVASTYMRGISLILIPTTLLAMVDASIGGKTAVNTPFSKNSIGTFYLPKAIFMDTSLLLSLDEREYRTPQMCLYKEKNYKKRLL
jgi:3-dehydroquinate synthetase